MNYLILLLTIVGMGLSGCGKDMKVSVRATESEKDQPSAALVRKVEVSYHDPAGHEQLRENIPVLGLAQPVSMRSDLLKDVRVEKDGVFEARGYSGDGMLLLRGVTRADPDEADTVEVLLNRDASHPATMALPVLRRIRLVDAPISGDFTRTEADLRAESRSGRCLVLPDLRMSPSLGAYPKLILEGAVKGASFQIEVGHRKDDGSFQLAAVLGPKMNPVGDAQLELGRTFLEGGGDRLAALLPAAARRADPAPGGRAACHRHLRRPEPARTALDAPASF
ncbi:MAG: hypothetical protein HY075_03645 [Deltaproteobacteria bacterium]|nr:hypothetical protein [Deltaproteobacteria bacterium]